jgi:zinc protease
MMMRSLIGLATAVLLTGSMSAYAQDTTTKPFTSYTLDNGLRVVLVPDHKVPKVAVTVTYNVGGLNEPTGRSGFAHLFEHLMFSGTDTYPSFDETFLGLGITNNAYTAQDNTTYWMDGLASALPVVLSVEADRMANIGNSVDQADLDQERAIVINELRQNVLDVPGAGTGSALYVALYPQPHPYSRAVLGSIPDVTAATLGDVKTFFNTYYNPNNAVLAVVGDFELADAEAMIEDTFGRIARGVEAPSPMPTEIEAARVHLSFIDAVSSPQVVIGFTGPTMAEEGYYDLAVTTDLLCNSNYGYVVDALVNPGISTGAGCSWNPGKLGGRFTFYAGAAPGISVEQLEAAMRKTLTDFLATPLDPEAVERSRNIYLLQGRTAYESYKPRSETIANSLAATGNLDGIFEDDPDLLSVSPETVAATMKSVLVLADSSTAVVVPGPRGDMPAVFSEPSGEPAPMATVARASVDIPKLQPAEQNLAQLPATETATLANGITVVHMQLPDAPIQNLTIAAAGGILNDPAGKEGLHEMALGLASTGAGDLDQAALAKAASDVNAGIGGWTNEQLSGISIAVPPETFAEGVDLLAEVVLEPRFDEQPFKVQSAMTLEGLRQRQTDPSSLAYRALNAAMFDPAEGYPGINITIASIGSITLDEVKQAFREQFVPAGVTVYSVGPMALKDILPALETRFGAWHADGMGLTAREATPVTFPKGQVIYVVPQAGATQTVILTALPAPGTEQPHFAEATAVMNLLGGDFSSRLNQVIRVQKGYSYGVNGVIMSTFDDSGAIALSTAVESSVTGEALTEIFAGLDSLATSPPTQAEIDRTVTQYQTMMAGMSETAGGLFNSLVMSKGVGRDLDSNLDMYESVIGIGLTGVQAEAATLASLDQSIIVLSGDPDVIMAELKSIGIEDVELMAAAQ